MNTVFERVEKKYLLQEEQYLRLQEALCPYMKQDHYGLHTICNIYFDTEQNELIRRSLDKPIYKEKFRIRSYGVPTEDDMVFLEIKKKYKGVVYKRRAPMKLWEAKEYLGAGVCLKDSQIMREIDYMIHHYQLVPALFLAYDRKAWYGLEDSELRITFDTDIRSRAEQLDLSLGDYGSLLMPKGYYLMEIKVPGSFPIWLAEILCQLSIYPVSFSKYGKIYCHQQSGGNEVCLPVY